MDDFIQKKEKLASETRSNNKVSLGALFGKNYRKRLALGCVLNFMQQMTGINFMTMFSTQLFDRLSGNGAQMTMVLSFGTFAGALFSLMIIKLGRRSGMLYTTALSALNLFILLLWIKYEVGPLAMLAMFLNVFGFGAGFASIFNLYTVEILPALGVGLAFTVRWMTASLLGFFGPIMLRFVGIQVIVGIFCVFTSCSCLVMYCFCKETAGKTEEEINKMFRPNNVHNQTADQE